MRSARRRTNAIRLVGTITVVASVVAVASGFDFRQEPIPPLVLMPRDCSQAT
jgi:hypothetical protein